MAAPAPSKLDAGQILKHSFDDAAGRLRVDAEITADLVGIDVNISQDDDSIRVGGGGPLVTATTDSGKTGLDVNVINDIELSISHTDDSIRLGNGTDFLTSTTDGSKIALDVNVINSADVLSTTIIEFNEITSVASGATTTILSYTALTDNLTLQNMYFAGSNIAKYILRINSVIIDQKYTYYGSSLNDSFNFSVTGSDGFKISSGDVVDIQVIHQRPYVGDFNARIQLVETI